MMVTNLRRKKTTLCPIILLHKLNFYKIFIDVFVFFLYHYYSVSVELSGLWDLEMGYEISHLSDYLAHVTQNHYFCSTVHEQPKQVDGLSRCYNICNLVLPESIS